MAPRRVTKRRKATPRQLAFAKEYLRNGRVAHQAYETVYGPHDTDRNTIQGRCRVIFQHPAVAMIIERANASAQAEIDMAISAYALSKRKLVLELLHLATANMRNYVTVDGGQPYVDLSAVTDAQWAAVKELTVDEIPQGEDHPVVVRVKVKLADKVAAIEKLCRLMGYAQPESTAPSTPDRLPDVHIYLVPSRPEGSRFVDAIPIEYKSEP
jgi:hypothetical protein